MNLLRKLAVTGLMTAAIAGAGVSGGCIVPADPDPGVCYTTGEFDPYWVEVNTVGYTAYEYVHLVCGDWVRLLIQNCVDVYGVPLFPTQYEIDQYCDNEIYEDSEGYYNYRIEHSCNFVDNPSFECSLFEPGASAASAEVSILDAPAPIRERVKAAINGNERLLTHAGDVVIHLGGTTLTFAELLAD